MLLGKGVLRKKSRNKDLPDKDKALAGGARRIDPVRELRGKKLFGELRLFESALGRKIGQLSVLEFG
jgi:hypothetical protein